MTTHGGDGRFALIGGIEMSTRVCRALCEHGMPPCVAFERSRKDLLGLGTFRELGDQYGFPVHEVRRLGTEPGFSLLRTSAPDVLLFLGWSEIVNREVIAISRRGAFGIHPTRLPAGRGPCPIQHLLLRREKKSAVTLFALNEGVDDGDLVTQVPFEIGRGDDARSLYDRMTQITTDMLIREIPSLLAGCANGIPQNADDATSWPRLFPEDGRIDWKSDCESVYDRIRAFAEPFGGALTRAGTHLLRVWRAAPPTDEEAGHHSSHGGLVFEAPSSKGGITVACAGGGAIRLLEFGMDGRILGPTELFEKKILRKGTLLL